MKKYFSGITIFVLTAAMLTGLSGCAALQKKFTPKKKQEKKTPIFYKGRKYDIKPSIELYEKHYIFWINWERKIIAELGKSFKNDVRCMQEIVANLRDMQALISDEKAAELQPHIDDLQKARAIIEKRNMTKANETRIRLILEREYRIVKREFSPRDMEGSIRQDWRKD